MSHGVPHKIVSVEVMARKAARTTHGFFVLQGAARDLATHIPGMCAAYMNTDRKHGRKIEDTSRRSATAASFSVHLKRG